MGKKLMMLMMVFLVTISLSACTMIKVAARGNQPIILNTLPEKYLVLGHFEKVKSYYFDFTRSPDISALVRQGVASYPDADAVVNVSFSVEVSVGDWFMNLFTLGFANGYTLRVEGDVVRSSPAK